MHVQVKLRSSVLDVLQSFLVVGTSTADPDGDLVLVELTCNFTDSLNDTLEGGSHVGEVGNTTTDEQNLTLRVLRSTEHEVKDSLGVVEGLGLGWRTRVLSVVGELTGETGRGDSISVNDGGTTTSNESPDTSRAVEDGELEGSTSLGVKVSNVGLLLAHLTTERCRELHGWADVDGLLAARCGKTESAVASGNGPLGTALELGSLVNLGSQVEEVNLGGGGISIGDGDKGVDLEVARTGISMI
jgi:hypothetical protein